MGAVIHLVTIFQFQFCESLDPEAAAKWGVCHHDLLSAFIHLQCSG
jgi:hypothetical protein